MTKICRGGTSQTEGQTTWTIPYTPHGEGEATCTLGGGVVENTGGGCGSASSSQGTGTVGGGTVGNLALISGAFLPALALRDSLAGSQLVRDLDVINEHHDLPRIIAGDAAISAGLGEAVGMAAGFAVDLLLDTGAPAVGLPYSASLQEWFAELAGRVRCELEDETVVAAVDRVVALMESYVGSSIREIYGTLRDEAAACAPAAEG
jgi:hypothetical protein